MIKKPNIPTRIIVKNALGTINNCKVIKTITLLPAKVVNVINRL